MSIAINKSNILLLRREEISDLFMPDNKEIIEEAYRRRKERNCVAIISLVVGSTLTILSVEMGLREGFHDNYIKLFVGVFLMILSIVIFNRATRESARKNKEKESLRKEIEKVFDTPEKKINAPVVKMGAAKSFLYDFYCLLLLLSVFFFFVSLGAIIAGVVLSLDPSDNNGRLIGIAGIVSILSCCGLFILSLYLVGRASK